MPKNKVKAAAAPPVLSPDGILRRQRYPYPEKTSVVFSVFMLGFFVLLVGPGRYTDLTAFKFQGFAALTGVYLAALLFVWAVLLLNPNYFRARQLESSARLTVPQIFALCYLAAAVLSSVLSPYSYNIWLGMGRYEGLLSVLLYTVLFLALSFWGEYSRWYFPALAGGAAVFSVIGLLQLCGLNVFGLYPESLPDFASANFISTLGNIDMVGGFVALAVPALCCFFVLSPHRVRWLCLASAAMLFFIQLVIDVDSSRVGLCFALLVMIPLLFTEQQRIGRGFLTLAVLSGTAALRRLILFPHESEAGGFLVSFGKAALLPAAAALLFGVLARLLLCGPLKLRISPQKLRRVLLLLLAVLIAAGLVFLYFYSGDNRLLHEGSELLHGRLSDEAGTYRGTIWKAGWTAALRHPVFGTGPDTFLEACRDLLADYPQRVDFAHNDFLQITVNYGFAGLACYLGFLLSLAFRAFRRSAVSPLVLPFIAGLCGYLAHSFFSFSIAILSPFMWMLAGLLDHLIRELPPLPGGDAPAAPVER